VRVVGVMPFSLLAECEIVRSATVLAPEKPVLAQRRSDLPGARSKRANDEVLDTVIDVPAEMARALTGSGSTNIV
jgi:hypothetical protein